MTSGCCLISAGSPIGQSPSVVEDGNAVAGRHHHVHVVLDQHDCDAGGFDRADQIHEPAALDAIEAGCRFIKQQQRRGLATKARAISMRRCTPWGKAPAGTSAMCESSTNSNASWARATIAFSSDFCADVRSSACQSSHRVWPCMPNHDVLEHAHLAEQLEVLKGAPDACARPALGRPARDIVVAEVDLSCR